MFFSEEIPTLAALKHCLFPEKRVGYITGDCCPGMRKEKKWVNGSVTP